MKTAAHKNIRSITPFGAAVTKFTAGLALLAAGAAAQAAVITSSADALLTGASLIDFSEVAVGAVNPTIAGVSFTGIGAQLTTLGFAFAGQTSPILGNSAVPPGNSSVGVPFDIVFGTDVSAFSLDLAAVASNSTTISAYDDNDMLLETVSVTGDSGQTHTWGLGGYASLIARVHIATNDFFFTDNLRYVEANVNAVPEPGSSALAGLALLGLATLRRRHPAQG